MHRYYLFLVGLVFVSGFFLVTSPVIACTDGNQTGVCQASCDASAGEQTIGSGVNVGCSDPTMPVCCVLPTGSGHNLTPQACAALGGQCQPDFCPGSLGNCSGTLYCCKNSASGTPGGPGPGTPGGPGPGTSVTVTFSNLLSFTTVEGLLNSILGWLQGIVATLALLMIVIGGFFYISSGGDSGRAETAKKIVTGAVIGLALALAAPSFLREIALILGWGGVGTLPGTQLSLLAILKNVMNFLLSIVGIVAIIMLIVGAIMYLTAVGDEDRIDTGKAIVKYSIIGILIALASLVIVTQLANFFA